MAEQTSKVLDGQEFERTFLLINIDAILGAQATQLPVPIRRCYRPVLHRCFTPPCKRPRPLLFPRRHGTPICTSVCAVQREHVAGTGGLIHDTTSNPYSTKPYYSKGTKI
jgi:hypothetical protein